VRRWYEPHLARLYEAPGTRAGDLEQLEQIAANYRTREQFLSELTLDPPQAVGDQAGSPLLDEDFLILSTIHSAKGQEWDIVYVLNVVDGCIPSDMATGTPEEIEEERRLLYVAMTRARDQLHLVHTHKFYTRMRTGRDNHLYAPRSRFIPDSLLGLFERRTEGARHAGEAADVPAAKTVDVPALLRQMWA
jgi:DNA helicase-2/ATP-dependent DNA helicase PcrA